MEASERPKKPLIIRFKIPGERFFIYDSLTNMFFEVDKVNYDVLEFYKVIDNDEIIKKLEGTHSKADLEKSLKIIKEKEEKHGLFSDKRATCMSFVHEEGLSFYDDYKDKCKQLILEVTQSCNLRCKYCTFSGHYAYQRTHNTAEMSWETAKAAVDWFLGTSKSQGEKSVTFYGGEPLLKFDLIKKIIDYVKDKGEKLRHSFTTNGTLLGKREIIDHLAANNVNLLVSLDGPPEVHDAYRVFAGGGPTHKVIMDNLRKIYELYPEYYSMSVNCITTLAYEKDMPKVYEFFRKDHGFPLKLGILSNVDASDTDFYEIYGKQEKEKGGPFDELYKKYCDMLINNKGGREGAQDKESDILHQLFDGFFIGIHRRCMEKHDEMHMNGCCVPGQRRVFVETDGNMLACEKLGNKYSLGNVKTGGFDMNKVKAFIDDYIKLSFTDCKECTIQRLCRLCFRSAMQNGIMTRERKRECCKAAVKNITENLLVYIMLTAKNKDAFKFIDKMTIS